MAAARQHTFDKREGVKSKALLTVFIQSYMRSIVLLGVCLLISSWGHLYGQVFEWDKTSKWSFGVSLNRYLAQSEFVILENGSFIDHRAGFSGFYGLKYDTRIFKQNRLSLGIELGHLAFYNFDRLLLYPFDEPRVDYTSQFGKGQSFLLLSVPIEYQHAMRPFGVDMAMGIGLRLTHLGVGLVSYSEFAADPNGNFLQVFELVAESNDQLIFPDIFFTLGKRIPTRKFDLDVSVGFNYSLTPHLQGEYFVVNSQRTYERFDYQARNTGFILNMHCTLPGIRLFGNSKKEK